MTEGPLASIWDWDGERVSISFENGLAVYRVEEVYEDGDHVAPVLRKLSSWMQEPVWMRLEQWTPR